MILVEAGRYMQVLKKIGSVLLYSGVVLFMIGLYLIRPAMQMDNYAKFYHHDTTLIGHGQVRATFFGVSTILFDDGDTQLMIDGFFSRPSMVKVLTSQVSTDTLLVNQIISQYRVHKLKAIFVTHSHYEHAMDAAYMARKTNSILHGSPSTIQIGLGGGLTDDHMAVFDLDKEYQYGDFTVKVIQSKHSPAAAYNDDLGKIINKPLQQPVRASDYVEGGSFDFLIQHEGRTVFVKPSANYILNKLTNIRADVLFLGVGGLSNQDSAFINAYYHQTVGMMKPSLVIPLHWDNFFQPFSDRLQMNPRLMDKTHQGFDFLIDKARSNHLKFTILQGGKSILLFNSSQ
jgi:L-ascorbate metabolism protein UlaG (beta-lactamase superfamily)